VDAGEGADQTSDGGVPRGPPEWGEILYQPDWAAERRFMEPEDLSSGVSLLVLAGVLFWIYHQLDVFYGFDSRTTGNVLIILSLLVTWAGTYFLRWGLKMPFRVYETGFTIPLQLSWTWFLNREVFVPAERIRHIVFARGIVILYTTEEGRGRRHFIKAPPDDDGYHLQVLQALSRIAGDRFDESADRKLGYLTGDIEPSPLHMILETPWLDEFTGRSEALIKARRLVERRRKALMARWSGGDGTEGEVDSMGSVPSGTERPGRFLEDRGRVIAEQEYDQLHREMTRLRWDVLGETVMALVVLLGFAMAVVLSGGWAYLTFLVSIGLLVLTGLFVQTVHGIGRRVPRAVHENGIEALGPLGGSRFIPWFAFSSFAEVFTRLTFWPHLGSTGERFFSIRPWAERWPFLVLLQGVRRRVVFEPSFPQYSRLEGISAERVSNPDYITLEWKEAVDRDFRMLPWFLVGLALVIGLVSGWRLAVNHDYFPRPDTAAAVLFATVPVSLLFIAVVSTVYHRVAQQHPLAPAPDRRATWTGLVALLLVFGSVAALGWDQAWETQATLLADPDPGESDLPPGTYRDQALEARGPVVVHKDEELYLVNCTLEFSPDPWGNYGIWVGKGGYLEMVNTTVRSALHRIGYTFEVHGSAFIADSLLQHIAPATIGEESDGGLELHSPDVYVYNTNFSRAQGASVIVSTGSPQIWMCTFHETNGPGVVVVGGSPNITECTFRRCSMGVLVINARARIGDCAFENQVRGIRTEFSKVTVEACTFDSVLIAITSWGERPTVRDCVFEGVDAEELKVPNDSEVFCLAWVIIMAVAVLSVELKKDRWPSGGKKPKAPDHRSGEDAPDEESGPSPEPANDRGDGRGDHDVGTGAPVYVECPRCVTINKVTTTERPYEFRCSKCGALLRLSK